MDAAWDLIKDFNPTKQHALHNGVPKHALSLPFHNGTTRDLAIDAVDIAHESLRRRARLNRDGQNKTGFLDVITEITENNVTAAERKLTLYHGT